MVRMVSQHFPPRFWRITIWENIFEALIDKQIQASLHKKGWSKNAKVETTHKNLSGQFFWGEGFVFLNLFGIFSKLWGVFSSQAMKTFCCRHTSGNSPYALNPLSVDRGVLNVFPSISNPVLLVQLGHVLFFVNCWCAKIFGTCLDFGHVWLKLGSDFQTNYLQGVEYGESGEGKNRSHTVVLQVLVVKNGFSNCFLRKVWGDPIWLAHVFQTHWKNPTIYGSKDFGMNMVAK